MKKWFMKRLKQEAEYDQDVRDGDRVDGQEDELQDEEGNDKVGQVEEGVCHEEAEAGVEENERALGVQEGGLDVVDGQEDEQYGGE